MAMSCNSLAIPGGKARFKKSLKEEVEEDLF